MEDIVLSQHQLTIQNKPLLEFEIGDIGYFWDGGNRRYIRYGELCNILIGTSIKYGLAASITTVYFDHFSKTPPSIDQYENIS